MKLSSERFLFLLLSSLMLLLSFVSLPLLLLLRSYWSLDTAEPQPDKVLFFCVLTIYFPQHNCSSFPRKFFFFPPRGFVLFGCQVT